MSSNPWLTMWVAPRQTIRSLVEAGPSRGIFVLATVSALVRIFFYFNLWSFGLHYDTLPLIGIAVVLAPLIGYIWLYLLSRVFFITGQWFGGNAPLSHLETAVAWSAIPSLGTLLFWTVIICLAPDEAFINVGGGNPYVLFFNFFNILLALLMFSLVFRSIAEVQHFSFKKAVVNTLLSWLIFYLPILLAIFLPYYILRL